MNLKAGALSGLTLGGTGTAVRLINTQAANRRNAGRLSDRPASIRRMTERPSEGEILGAHHNGNAG